MPARPARPWTRQRSEDIRAGDVVWTPPGLKHWHGASPTAAMTHIAMTEPLGGKTADWMEKVSDAEYGARVAPRGSDGQEQTAQVDR